MSPSWESSQPILQKLPEWRMIRLINKNPVNCQIVSRHEKGHNLQLTPTYVWMYIYIYTCIYTYIQKTACTRYIPTYPPTPPICRLFTPCILHARVAFDVSRLGPPKAFHATPQGGHPRRSTPHPSGDAAYPRKYSNPQPCHHKHASIEGKDQIEGWKIVDFFALGQWMIFVKLGSGWGLEFQKQQFWWWIVIGIGSNTALLISGMIPRPSHFITNTPASNWKWNPQFMFPLKAIGGTLTQEITREITWTNKNPRPSQQPGLKEKQLGSLPWKWNCPKKTHISIFCLQSNWYDTVDGRNPAPLGMYKTL